MENKIIQSLWVGEELSTVEYLCVSSFLQNGHEFHLYTYSDHVKNCPAGTILMDANEIIPKERVYRDVLGTLTSFANWFRYRLLYERGGWWVDMDVVCLKYFDFDDEYCFTTEVMFQNDQPKIIANNAIIKSPPNAAFLEDMLTFMENRNIEGAHWGTYGSVFLQRVLAFYDSEEFIKPPEYFCPINWHEIEVFFEDCNKFDFDCSYAIHLWNNIWSKKGIDKNATFPPDSLIENLKFLYLNDSGLTL